MFLHAHAILILELELVLTTTIQEHAPEVLTTIITVLILQEQEPLHLQRVQEATLLLDLQEAEA